MICSPFASLSDPKNEPSSVNACANSLYSGLLIVTPSTKYTLAGLIIIPLIVFVVLVYFGCI